MELNEEEVNEVGRQVSSWLKRLHTEGSAALREMRNWDKAKLRESLVGYKLMSLNESVGLTSFL